ncbi:MAG: acyltransferase, partial [Puniceicoccales bacterium]|nr:acyltransferase [Puniceicoccales bacterium]
MQHDTNATASDGTDEVSKKREGHAYIPALDGIRAIAILGVFIYHISPLSLPGGFLGVDVFFVLSGFLITSIILHDLKNKQFSFSEFYLRRIQRLLPNAI